MSVTAMILVTVVWLDMDLTKLPGLGVTLAHPAPKGVVIALLLVFFLYFLSAISVKYWRENAQIRESASTLRQAEKTLGESIEKLLTFSPPDHLAQVKAFSAAVEGEYKTYETRFLERLRALTEWQSQRWNRGDLRTEHLGREAFMVSEVQGPLNREEVESLHKRYTWLMSESQRLSDMDYDRQLKDLANFGEEFVTKNSAAMSEAFANVDAKIEAAKQDFTAQGPDIEKALNEVTKKTDALRKEMRRLAGAIAWDHLVLGFWLPVLFFSACVFLSIPKAIPDIKRSFSYFDISPSSETTADVTINCSSRPFPDG